MMRSEMRAHHVSFSKKEPLIPSETATSGSLGSFASRATSANPEIMGKFPVSAVLKTVGWASWRRQSPGWTLPHQMDDRCAVLA